MSRNYAIARERGRVHAIRRYAPLPGRALCGFKPKHRWFDVQKMPHPYLSPCRRCSERVSYV
jgi:hypothetical protein